jgi:hypothetical protein
MKIEQIKEKQVKIKNYYINNLLKIIVREKSRAILKLLEDRDKLMEERKNYSQWRSRIEGVGSDGTISSISNTGFSSYGGGAYGATSSDNYNTSSYDDYNNYNKKKKKKKKKESDDESSSEDDDDDNKKKKKKKKS